MLEPVFENRSIFKRQDELMLKWLAEATVKGLNESDAMIAGYCNGEISMKIFTKDLANKLHVIRDTGVYWDGLYITQDTEVIGAAAALLALLGRLDLVYRSTDEYDRVNKPASNDAEDTLGDLDDHPF